MNAISANTKKMNEIIDEFNNIEYDFFGKIDNVNSKNLLVNAQKGLSSITFKMEYLQFITGLMNTNKKSE